MEFLIRGSSPETPRSARTISCHTHVDHFGPKQEYGLSQYVLSFCRSRILAAHPLLPISGLVFSAADSFSMLPSRWTSVSRRTDGSSASSIQVRTRCET